MALSFSNVHIPSLVRGRTWALGGSLKCFAGWLILVNALGLVIVIEEIAIVDNLIIILFIFFSFVFALDLIQNVSLLVI